MADTLIFQPSQIAFGSLRPHQSLSQTVTLENRGTETTKILATRTDCGCTVAQPSLEVLGPGESIQIEVTFDAQNLSGKVFREVSVVTDSGVATLPVFAFVNPFGNWSAEHTSLTFTGKAQEEAHTLTLNFTHPTQEGQASPRILTAWSPVDWLKPEIVSKGIPGQFTLNVTRVPNAPVGTLQTFIKVRTNTQEEELNIPVLARIQGSLIIHPNPITLGTGTVGTPRRKAISIEGWDPAQDPPTLLLPQGNAQFLGEQGGRLNYMLTLVPESAGILQVTLLVCPPDATQLKPETQVHAEVPVIMRALIP